MIVGVVLCIVTVEATCKLTRIPSMLKGQGTSLLAMSGDRINQMELTAKMAQHDACVYTTTPVLVAAHVCVPDCLQISWKWFGFGNTTAADVDIIHHLCGIWMKR